MRAAASGFPARAPTPAMRIAGRTTFEQRLDLGGDALDRGLGPARMQTAPPARSSSSAFFAWWSSAACGNGIRRLARPTAHDLGDRRRAGARDDEVRVRDLRWDVVEERDDARVRKPSLAYAAATPASRSVPHWCTPRAPARAWRGARRRRDALVERRRRPGCPPGRGPRRAPLARTRDRHEAVPQRDTENARFAQPERAVPFRPTRRRRGGRRARGSGWRGRRRCSARRSRRGCRAARAARATGPAA